MRMDHGTYVGPFTPLRGKKALLRPTKDGSARLWRPDHSEFIYIEAQFDELGLKYCGLDVSRGWHVFPETSFRRDPEVSE